MSKRIHKFPRLDKSKFSLHSLSDDLDDKELWFSKSANRRLEHIELLRILNYGDQASSRLKDFLKLLNSYKVDYLIIGGYAVGFHGYPRATADIDIWIANNPANADKIVKVLKDFGFNSPELSNKVFLQRNKIVRLGVAPVRIEILTNISGVDFAECYQRKTTAFIDRVKVKIISLDCMQHNLWLVRIATGSVCYLKIGCAFTTAIAQPSASTVNQ